MSYYWEEVVLNSDTWGPYDLEKSESLEEIYSNDQHMPLSTRWMILEQYKTPRSTVDPVYISFERYFGHDSLVLDELLQHPRYFFRSPELMEECMRYCQDHDFKPRLKPQLLKLPVMYTGYNRLERQELAEGCLLREMSNHWLGTLPDFLKLLTNWQVGFECDQCGHLSLPSEEIWHCLQCFRFNEQGTLICSELCNSCVRHFRREAPGRHRGHLYVLGADPRFRKKCRSEIKRAMRRLRKTP